MPAVHEYQIGDAPWYWVSVEFPTEAMARRAWEKLGEALPIGDLAVYRHGPKSDQGRVVTAVSLKRAEILRVARITRGSRDYDLDEGTLRGLILRRARQVLEANEAGITGRVKLRRPRGAVLDPKTGDMIERIGEG